MKNSTTQSSSAKTSFTCGNILFKLGGVTSDDEASDEETSDDEASDEETSDDEASDEETSDDETSDEETSDDETSDDETSDEETSDDETSDDETSDDETSDDETSDDESSDDETSDEEASDDESSDDETSDDSSIDEISEETNSEEVSSEFSKSSSSEKPLFLFFINWISDDETISSSPSSSAMDTTGPMEVTNRMPAVVAANSFRQIPFLFMKASSFLLSASKVLLLLALFRLGHKILQHAVLNIPIVTGCRKKNKCMLAYFVNLFNFKFSNWIN